MEHEELNFDLIRGRFGVDDANLLLMELLRFKIGFHEQKLFQDYKDFNQDNSNSKSRIEALNKALQDLRRLMATAKDAGDTFEIDCAIHIRRRSGS